MKMPELFPIDVCLNRYGCTKWATEVQLQQLHREYGVPVSVFRCGMILAHSKCALFTLTSHPGVAEAANLLLA